ncbi:MAG: ThiF family adenylyltransferase, partial [Phascolarctobacterium sp.]|nr:ThiF family adenylyltransferase [Phascolarctobacterium sp.]
MNQFQRTELLIGKSGIEKLNKAHVAVFGVGGVGGYVVEALVRSGIGEITIVDNDDINLTNINRQIIATHETIGRSKVEVMAERIKSINPNCNVHAVQTFFLPENADQFDFTSYDYVVDAIDTVAAKIA